MANRRDTPSPWLKSVAYALIISFSALVAFMLVTVDSAVSGPKRSDRLSQHYGGARWRGNRLVNDLVLVAAKYEQEGRL